MTFIPGEKGFISTDNSTSETLGSGSTYTGTWEDISEFASITIIATAVANATLLADFSTDGVTVTRTVQLSSGTDTALGIHSLITVAQYFRVRLTDTGGGGAIVIQSIYNTAARISQPTSRLGQSLTTFSDVLNVRSVIANTGGVNANVTNHRALQTTPPTEGKNAFGGSLVTEITPVIEMEFHTFINPVSVTTRANQSGTVTNAGGMAVCTTGAAANSSAAVLSNEVIRYHPGQGIRVRFTALFTTGVANSIQFSGIGDEGNGFFFGYDGTSFGVLRRTGGVREMRTLTVTTASTTAENITITLDGDANAAVAVTNTGDVTLTANEIADADYSDTGRGWDACAVGDTVIFTSWNDEPRTGTYSLSGASTAVGTFAQTIAGVSPTDNWTAQASWNGDDIFDGNGLTGVTLDPTKGNVYQIDYQGSGFGAIAFFIEDPADGEMHKVHTIQYSNANTVLSIERPTLSLRTSAENFSNTSSLVTKTSAMGAFVDGKDEYFGTRLGIKANKTLSGTAAETPVLTLRCSEVLSGKHNHGELKISLVAAAVEHTKAVAINFYANPVLTGASFSDVNAAASQAQVDTSATAFTNGTFLFAIDLGRTGNAIVNLKDDKHAALITPGNWITATIAPTSGNNSEGTVSFNFIDLF